MNQLSASKRAEVIAALIEGNSIRSTVRMTGVAKNTISKLLLEIGAACSNYQDQVMRNLRCKLVQVDEIWSFVGCKQRNVKVYTDMPVMGDVWTWVAIDAETKLVPTFLVGNRDVSHAAIFMRDLADRMANRIQLTSDGHKTYLKTVPGVFGGDIDYAMLRKLYSSDANPSSPERRYSPGYVTGATKEILCGAPEVGLISTSFVERQNLTMRMCMRRFTRLTNAFSRKIENHAAAIALHFMAYNFVKVHRTIKTTPAVAAGIADRVWTVADIVALIEREQVRQAA